MCIRDREYLAFLKGRHDDPKSEKSQAFQEFMILLERARKIIAAMYQEDEEENGGKKIWKPENISASDLEKVICSGIPINKMGNLKKMSASILAKHFSQKRFSRQRINNILNHKFPVERFDLILSLIHILPVHNQGVDGILAGHTQHWQLPMLAVFDGMGGESYGEMAASAAVEALGGFYEENKKTLKKEPVVFLTGACENMNEAVCRYSNENCIRSMGTTMALLSFSEKAIYACNLGDSRIYRHFQGKFQQISTDHVIGGKMLGKAPLTQYLGFQDVYKRQMKHISQ